MDEEKRTALNNLKCELLGIVLSVTNQMDMNTLMRDYRKTVGCSIPVHLFGYKSVLTFLRDECSDKLRFHGDPYNPILVPVVSNDVKHVDQLISKQKSSKLKSFTPRRKTYACGNARQYASNDYPRNSSTPTDSSARTSNQPFKDNVSPVAMKQSSNFYANDNYKPSTSTNNYQRSLNLSDSPRRLQRYNPNDGRNDTKPWTAIKENTYNNRQSSPPEIQTDSRNSQKHDKNCEKTESSINLCEPASQISHSDFPKNHRLSKKLIDNLKELIDAYPEGLWCRELLSAYKKKYAVDLQPMRLGYKATVSLCKDLPMVFKITRPRKQGDWRLFPLSSEIPPEFRDGAEDVEETKKENSHSKIDIDSLVFGTLALPGVKCDESLYPKECAVYGESLVGPLPPPDIFTLQICEVKDPSHFWFLIVSNSASVALDTIMDEINEFYYNDPSAKDYCMVRAAARTGQLCAVPYNGVFHRAIVIKNISLEEVLVFYLDYGTVSKVKFSDMRMLLNRFCDLAVQGHRGRLGGVAPLGTQWDAAAKIRFMELVRDKNLQGQVLSRSDEDNSIISLKIVNTLEEIDIGDILISEGLATKDNGTKKGHLLSFDYLENRLDEEYNRSEDETIADETNTKQDPIKDIENNSNLVKDSNSPIVPSVVNNKKPADYVIKKSETPKVVMVGNESEIENVVKNDVSGQESECKNIIGGLTKFFNVSEHSNDKDPNLNISMPGMNPKSHDPHFIHNQLPQMQNYHNYPLYMQPNLGLRHMNPYNTPYAEYGMGNMSQQYPPYHPYQMDMTRIPPQIPNNFNQPPIYNNQMYVGQQNQWSLNNQFPLVRPSCPQMLHQFQPQNPSSDFNNFTRMRCPPFVDNTSNNIEKSLLENICKSSQIDKVNTSTTDLMKKIEKVKNITNNNINNDNITSNENKIDNSNGDKGIDNNTKINNHKINNMDMVKHSKNSECKLINRSLETMEASLQEEQLSKAEDIDLLSSDDEEILKPHPRTDQIELTLKAITDAFGECLEIWEKKCDICVILQQSSKAFLNIDDLDTLCETFLPSDDGDVAICTLIQDAGSVVGDILSEIKKTGRSGFKEGDTLKIINKRNVEPAPTTLVLIPIDILLNILCSKPEFMKRDVLDLIQYLMELNMKYNAAKFDDNSTDTDSENV